MVGQGSSARLVFALWHLWHPQLLSSPVLPEHLSWVTRQGSFAVDILYIPCLLFCWIHSLSQSQVRCGTGDKKGGQGQLSEPELLLMALCCETSACSSWCPCVHRNFADETSADGNSCLVKLGEEL